MAFDNVPVDPVDPVDIVDTADPDRPVPLITVNRPQVLNALNPR